MHVYVYVCTHLLHTCTCVHSRMKINVALVQHQEKMVSEIYTCTCRYVCKYFSFVGNSQGKLVQSLFWAKSTLKAVKQQYVHIICLSVCCNFFSLSLLNFFEFFRFHTQIQFFLLWQLLHCQNELTVRNSGLTLAAPSFSKLL